MPIVYPHMDSMASKREISTLRLCGIVVHHFSYNIQNALHVKALKAVDNTKVPKFKLSALLVNNNNNNLYYHTVLELIHQCNQIANSV